MTTITMVHQFGSEAFLDPMPDAAAIAKRDALAVSFPGTAVFLGFDSCTSCDGSGWDEGIRCTECDEHELSGGCE